MSSRTFSRYVFSQADRNLIGLFCGKGRRNLKTLSQRAKTDMGYGGLFFEICDEGVTVMGYNAEACDYGKSLVEEEFERIKETKRLKTLKYNIGTEVDRDTYYNVLNKMVRGVRLGYDQTLGMLTATSFSTQSLDALHVELDKYMDFVKNEKRKLMENVKKEEKEVADCIQREKEEKERQVELRRKQKAKNKEKNFKKRERKKKKSA